MVMGVGEDEILSSDDDDLNEYLKEADELVMSPHANVSNRTEMTSLGNLDETVPVQDDVSQPSEEGKGNFCTEGSSQGIRASREGQT